jgi:hypothetical protein
MSRLLGPPDVARLRTKNRLRELVSALGDSNVGPAARDALVEIGPLAVQPLLAAHAKRHRRGALDGLVHTKVARKDRDLRAHRLAAEALGGIGDARAVPSLIRDLSDGDVGVRCSAAEALGRIGDAGAVGPFVECLKSRGAGHGVDAELHETIWTAIVRIGDTWVLTRLLTESDTSPSVRQVAVDALERLGWSPDDGPAGAAYWAVKGDWDMSARIGPAAVQPLLRAIRMAVSWRDREAAEAALAQIGPTAVRPLLGVFGEAAQNWPDREAAEAVLRRMGASAVQPLIAALVGEQSRIQRQAARTLGGIGDERAVEPLCRLLSRNDDLSASAAEALERLQPADRRALDKYYEERRRRRRVRTVEVDCGDCQGSGFWANTGYNRNTIGSETCSTCGGKGKVTEEEEYYL